MKDTHIRPKLTIALCRKYLDMADRLEHGGLVEWAEIEDFLNYAGQEARDAVDAALEANGEAPLPPHLNPGCPEFQAAFTKARECRSSGAGQGNAECNAALQVMFKRAPRWALAAIEHICDEMGALPKPDHMTESGDPLFSVACIAKHFGKTEAEVSACINQLGPGDFVTGPAFRIQ